MASSEKFAGAGATLADTPGSAWSSPGNITADDGSNAACTPSVVDVTSDSLAADAFGFAIPDGATIDGIVVTIARHQNFAQIRDVTVQLLKAGVATGDNKAITDADWPTSETEQDYGSSSDLWGSTWTDDDINHADFGVRLQVRKTSSSSTRADVDYITITVHYTEGGGGAATVSSRLSLLGVGL